MWAADDQESDKAFYLSPAHRNMRSCHSSPWVHLHLRYAEDQATVHRLAKLSPYLALCHTYMCRIIHSGNGQQGKPSRPETVFLPHFHMSHAIRIVPLLAPLVEVTRSLDANATASFSASGTASPLMHDRSRSTYDASAEGPTHATGTREIRHHRKRSPSRSDLACRPLPP